MSIRSHDTVVDCLRRSAQSAPDNGITLYGRHGDRDAITYPELLQRAHRFACGLRTEGGIRGDRVGLFLPSSIEFFVAYFGSLMAQAVPVTLPTPAFGKSLNHREALRLAAIVSDARLACLVEGAGLNVGNILPKDSCRRAEFNAVYDSGEANSGTVQLPPEQLDDPALIQYTSGSITTPRGVVLSERNISINIQTIADLVDMNPSDTIDLWIPLFHDMGLMGSLATIASGANLRICAPSLFLSDPLGWLLRFAATGATINTSPHFFFRMLLEDYAAERAADLDLSRWRVAFNGAEMIQPDDVDHFLHTYGRHGFSGAALYPVYGLAEATLALAFPTYGEPVDIIRGKDALGADCPAPIRQRRFVSVGQALPGHELAIRALSGPEREDNDLPVQVGEIMARGPCIMQGYTAYGSAEPVRPYAGDWLPTRDLGFIHEGKLFVCGRMDEVIIVRGANFFPYDLEAIAENSGSFADVPVTARAAFGYNGSSSAEVALALELKRVPIGLELDDRIRRLEAELLRELGFPVHVLCLAHRAIPRTTSGKLKRLALPEMLVGGDLTGKILAAGRDMHFG